LLFTLNNMQSVTFKISYSEWQNSLPVQSNWTGSQNDEFGNLSFFELFYLVQYNILLVYLNTFLKRYHT
jgi:hypothetical protein